MWATIGIHELTFFVARCLRSLGGRPTRTMPAGSTCSAAFGGVLGGLFNALIAPILFDQVLEYPMLLVAVLLCAPPEGRTLARNGSRSSGTWSPRPPSPSCLSPVSPTFRSTA